MSRHIKVVAAALLLATATGYAHETRFQTEFSRDLQYRGGNITIDHQFGGVTIDTGSSSEVNVRATIRSSDPTHGQQIRIEAESTGSGVSIRTVYPSSKTTIHNDDFSFSVDYRITVPASAPLRVRNRFGSVKATGIASGSEIVNGHGSITLSDGRGRQTVENSFGSIQIRDNGGDALIRNSHGSVNAKTIRGSADITNRFGSVTVGEVEKETVVRNANGSVVVKDVRGNANVVNSFGSLSVQGVNGSAQVNGNHSRIIVKDVRGDAGVTTTFGAIEVQGIGGTLTVTNQNGTVKAGDISRDATIRTSFASVIVSEVAGAVDVQNQNGAISVGGLRSSTCRPISLRTSFASIKVGLPANANYAVNARTSYGRIISDLPITATSIGGDTVIGTIGRGSCKLELINNNGSITIDKD